MDNWDEIRTAYQVARLGTVSGAAEVLGVHHATVIRHIDALEDRLGVKLFQRHSRGYTATEAGQDLLQVAKATDDQFAQLASRIKGQGDGLEGELVITSLAGLSPLITPVLVGFRRENPDIRIRFLTDNRLFRLEYGEAHIAIRAGEAPDQPDNVVQPFFSQRVALVASQAYVDEFGLPERQDDFARHSFIGPESAENRAPFNRWLTQNVPADRIVYRASDNNVLIDAVTAGAGIGFVPIWEKHRRPDLVEVMAPEDEWSAPFWLVTHVDLHRMAKVQAFLKYIKTAAKGWTC